MNKKLLFNSQFCITSIALKVFRATIGLLVLSSLLIFNSDNVFAQVFTTHTITDDTGTYPFYDTASTSYKAIFSLDSTGEETLDINGKKVYVRGNLFFTAQNNEVFTINIGNATSDAYVSIQPLAKRVVKQGTLLAPTLSGTNTTSDTIDVTQEMAQLIFCPSAGGVIEVNLYKDLIITGSNYTSTGVPPLVGPMAGSGTLGSYTAQDLSTDITMTFTGQGQTVFKLSDGKKLVFESQAYNSTTGAHSTANLAAGKGAGARVFVAMDDSFDNVVTKGINKVVFQRASYTGTSLDSRVRIGMNSFFTFVSNSITGVANNSYAAVAFDCSGAGTGRLELQITGNNLLNSYQDGAFIVSGNFLGTVDNAISTPVVPGSYNNAYDFLGDKFSTITGVTTTGVDFSQPAGDQAIVRVIDNLGYAESADYRASIASSNPNPGVTSAGAYTRRGLMVSNKVLSLSPMASNPYLDDGWFDLNAPEIDVQTVGPVTTRTVYNKVYPYRFGFVLGVNGGLEVSHNTFLEYVSLGYNTNVVPNNISAGTGVVGQTKLSKRLSDANVSVANSVFKQHNPSAMIIDGLYTMVDNLTGNLITHYEGSSTAFKHATITLLGNAGLSFRGDVLGTRINGSGYDSPAAYNGLTVPYPNQYDSSNNLTSYGETPGEGIHVLDIEGIFEIRSQKDSFITPVTTPDPLGWHTRSDYDIYPGGDVTKPLQGGVVRLPSIVRSIDDRELQRITDSALGSRPLTVGTLYHRYDKAAILANASFDFKNIKFINDDVTRTVSYNPADASPIILGGERAHFLSIVDKETNPDIAFMRVYNSEIHCSESMCVSGLRVIVRELPTTQKYTTSEITDNRSSIIFYNHGHSLDANLKGYGRLFLLGSNQNLVADKSTSSFLQSAYVNVFRHTGRIHGSSGSFLNKVVDLSVKTQFEAGTTVPAEQKSMHMFILGNNSYLDVGWTSTEGILRTTDDETGYTVYPFDHMKLGEVKENQTFNIKVDSQDYNPTTKVYTDNLGELPASLTISGDYIFFGAQTATGAGSPRTVNQFNLGRVIYVNHGGKMSITQDTSVVPARPYIGFSDATIAIRVWKDVNNERGLNPIILLPGDQMKLSNPVSPYDIDLNQLTDVNSPYLNFKTLAGKGFGTEVRIAWDKVKNISTVPFMSPLNLGGLEMDFSEPSRALSIRTTPVSMPTSGLTRMTTGDYLDQLSVSGATPSNPFRIYMSGDSTGVSQVREFTAVKSDSLVPGEGPFAKLYVDQGAVVGLGTRNWNLDSVGAWTKLGLSQVTIYANGNGQVDVNSNLIVADSQPIVPTTNFGSDVPDTTVGAPVGSKVSQTHQLSFHSVGANELRIPAGRSLDLSAFGKADTTVSNAVATQQIAMSGKIKLIFEPGSELRFPDLGDSEVTGNTVDKCPILYMNEESEIVFESARDIGQSGKTALSSLADTNRAKIRILGCGQIWLNKNAKMKVHDNAIVAIEADAQTPNTNVTISIQREGELTVGDLNNAGGSFQVGNPTAVTGAKIDFTLRLNGEKSRFEIGRNGFLGIGVGTVRNTSTKINNWTISPLANVRSFRYRNIKGIFSHNRVYDGTSVESSLMAIGPADGYVIEHGPTDSYLFGGGNVIFMRADVATNPFPVSVLSNAVDLAGTTADSGKYSIMTTTQTLRQLRAKPLSGLGSTSDINVINSTNSAYLNALKITAGDIPLLTGGTRFIGDMVDAFRYLTAGGVNEIRQQSPYGFVALGHTISDDTVGYVNNDTESIAQFGGNIVRSTIINMKPGELYTASLPFGALRVANSTVTSGRGNPVNYTSVTS